MTETLQIDGLHVLHAAPPSAGGQARAPLLLVHGAGHGAWCWERWLERLPELGREAWAPSLRNHPGSRAVDRETYQQRTGVDDYADDVAAVARHIGRPVVVVGHSMGGIVVQRFAQRHLAAGGRLAGLVLLASVGPGQLGPVRDAPVPTDQPYAPSPERAAQLYFHSAAPDVVQHALEQICPESPSVVNEYSLGDGLPIAPEEITCPVLVVTAGHDHTVVPRDGRIADYYGGTWLHDAEDGHDLMLEAGWADLLQRIVEWADTHAAGG